MYVRSMYRHMYVETKMLVYVNMHIYIYMLYVCIYVVCMYTHCMYVYTYVCIYVRCMYSVCIYDLMRMVYNCGIYIYLYT